MHAEKNHRVQAAITALVIAAGEARRFGRAKQLLPWGADETILSQVVAQTRQTAGINAVRVVLGARAELIEAELRRRCPEVAVIHNPGWQKGMFTSIKAGLEFLRREPAVPDGILVLLGDMPFISREILTRFVRAADSHPGKAVIAANGRRPAHPYLIRPSHIGEILSLSGESGIRPFIQGHFAEAAKIDVSDRTGRTDIDTWEDYFARRPADSGPVIPPPPNGV